MPSSGFQLRFESKGDWSFHVLDFSHGKRVFEPLMIQGEIMNTIQPAEHKKDLLNWKRKIAKSIYDKRSNRLDSAQNYSISLGLRFNPERIGMKFDIENYLKPIYDGIAAGLFSENDPSQLDKFEYDDSNFKYLLTMRLIDAAAIEEGIILSIAVDT